MLSSSPIISISLMATLLALLAGAGAAGAAENGLRLSEAQLQAARVAFAPVQSASDAAPDTPGGAALRLVGRTLIPNTALDVVLAPAAGRVEALLVNPGETVRAGQPLARLHSAEVLAMQRELVSARARADVLRARVTRDESLYADGIIARNRLEEARAERDDAEARLREQRQLLRLAGLTDGAVDRIRGATDISASLTLRARRAGTVLHQDARPGQAMNAGDVLYQIATLDRLWLELQATREQARRISSGDRVTVEGCPDPGQVIATSLRLDDHSQTVTVRAELPGSAQCLAPNQNVEAALSPRAHATGLLRVPESALIRQDGRDYVFLREPGGVRAVEVQVERRAGGSAQISGALQPGNEIATTGLAALKGQWHGLGAAAE